MIKNWNSLIEQESKKQYFKNLQNFVETERVKTTIYPDMKDLFKAFRLTPFDKVKVVILGQDPYYNGSADGLAFSTRSRVTPASLQNIIKEADKDYFNNQGIFATNNLSQWAEQGVLLINTVFTVEQGKPGSHKEKGWETFTTAVLQALNEKNDNIAYLLWGNWAKSFGHLIDNPRHLVLTASHPSPKSAEGFFGCKHFSRANQHLTERQNGSKIGINWGLF